MRIDWFEWLTFGTAVSGAVRSITKAFMEGTPDKDKVKSQLVNAWYAAPEAIFDRVPEEKILACIDSILDLIWTMFELDKPTVPAPTN